MIILPAMMFMTKMKKAEQMALVLAGTISTMTVNKIANHVSAKRQYRARAMKQYGGSRQMVKAANGVASTRNADCTHNLKLIFILILMLILTVIPGVETKLFLKFVCNKSPRYHSNCSTTNTAHCYPIIVNLNTSNIYIYLIQS